MLRYVLAVQSTGKVHIAILFNALFLSDNPTGTYFFKSYRSGTRGLEKILLWLWKITENFFDSTLSRTPMSLNWLCGVMWIRIHDNADPVLDPGSTSVGLTVSYFVCFAKYETVRNRSLLRCVSIDLRNWKKYKNTKKSVSSCCAKQRNNVLFGIFEYFR